MKARFFALAALVLGLASCQNDLHNTNVSVGGEVDFQLAVSAPEFDITRVNDGDAQYGLNSAYGAIDYLGDEADNLRVDWTDVDLRYSLEVYDVESNYNASHVNPVKDRQVIIVDKYEPVVFDLRLVPNRNYHFVVFADFVPQGTDKVDGYNVSSDYQSELGLRHNIGKDLRSITLKNEAINDEVADAYFATLDVEIKNSAAQDMVLKRPYGKVRVVATDLHELNLNVDPAAVRVTYDALNANGFNAVTGAISGEYTTKQFVNIYNPVKKTDMNNHIYTGYNTDAYKVTNKNGVTRNTHMTLVTDYILAGSDCQHSIHFKMEVFQHGDSIDNLQNLIKSTEFCTEIPIQRNYLTTIIGNVLTTATEVNVTIDDNFTDEIVVKTSTAVVTNADELDAALVNPDIDTIIFDGYFEKIGLGFDVKKNVVFNMNNCELHAGSTSKNTTNSMWYAFQISGNNSVEINDANFTRAGISVSSGSDVIFNNGTIDHNPDRTGRNMFYATGEGTTITINDGTFLNDKASNKYIYAANNAIVYIKGGNFGGTKSTNKIVTANGGQVIITGGTFNFDPTTWVPLTGYTVQKSDSTWTVVAAE